MRVKLCGPSILVALFHGAVLAGAPELSFDKTVVDDTFQQGYQVSLADVDGDGRPDILALATTPTRLAWYRNPDWTRYEILSGSERNIDVAPHDIDGDGDADLALACEFSLGESLHGGLVRWLECPANPIEHTEWTAHDIDRVPTAHRIRWADITGDGRPDLVNLPIIGIGASPPEYQVGVQFKAYEVPKNPAKEAWPSHVIDNGLHMAHGIAIVDWDDSPPAEVLTASFEGVQLFRRGASDRGWESRHLGSGKRAARPGQGSSEVGMGRLGADGARYIAAIEPWHGNEVVVYTAPETGGGLWTRSVIDDSLADGHALACADFNGDGIDEIVAGYRGAEHNLYLYFFDTDADRWNRVTIDEGGMGAAGVVVADIDGNGAPDIVAIGTATNNIVLYTNTSGG